MPGTTPDSSGNEPPNEPPNEPTVVVPTGELPQGEPYAPPPQWNQLGSPQLGVGRGSRIAVAIGAVLLLIAVAVVAGIVLLGPDDDSKDTSKDDDSQTVGVDPTGQAPSSLDLPTIDPSDFPTDQPTIDPTDLPDLPDRPGGLPTSFPDLPSSFPTDPEGWEEWFSDYLEQVNP